MSGDRSQADHQQGSGGIQPDAWRFDIRGPVGILENHSKYHPEESPNDWKWVQTTDEPLYKAETIQEGKEEVINYVRERTNRHWSKEEILDEVESKFEEVFSSDE